MKIILVGAGGAGSNIVAYLEKNLSTENRSQFETMYIDTSLNNSTPESLADGTFYHIKSSHVDGEKLTGSGGVRKTNHPHIEQGVTEFINNNKLHHSKDLIIVVASLSGGTGSLVLPTMVKKLLGSETSVIGLVVADSTSYQYIHNSERSIVTLNSIATKIAPLPLLYFNNKIYKKDFDTDKIKMCNRDILTVLSTLSIFTSGENKDIDDKDMHFLFKPVAYDIPNGIYSLSSGKCELSEKELTKKRALLGRTLIAHNVDVVSPLANFGLLQYKEGRTDADLQGIDHVDLLLTDNLDELYQSLVDDKNSFTRIKDASSIPVSDEDEFAF